MTSAADLWNALASTTGATTTGVLPMIYLLGGTLIALFFLVLFVRAVMAVIHWLFF